MVYQFKPCSFIKADPQIAGEICEELEAQNNLTAKALLEVSRPESAPLHDEFEWNDSVAAEAYRETQALHIINCLCIKPESENAEPTRAFFNIVSADREFHHIETILKSADDTELLLKRALRELEAFEKKYRQLEKLAAVFDAFEQVKMTALKNRLLPKQQAE